MPWDRVWAIAHDAAKVSPETTTWVPCANFSRGAKLATLMAMRARVDEAAGAVLLSHPDRPDILVNPDVPDDASRLIEWVRPLADPDRAQPAFVVRAPGRGMTDSAFPSISILSHGSLTELARVMGQTLAMERFRGNIWIENSAPWVEFDWVGRELRIGGAVLLVRERITRCKATMVDPSTGLIDGDTLEALRTHWGHSDFGVYAEVIRGGDVSVGDEVILS